MKLRAHGWIGFISCLFFSGAAVESAYFGEVKTGLQNVAADRYGYSLFVPEEYTPDRAWPFVIALHDAGGRGEEFIQAWLGEAARRGVIVFCPTYEEPRGEAPFDHDKRLLRLKQEIQNQYEIDARRVLIAGSGTGGHYAFYLGLKYPKEFSAVASIGNAVRGTLEQWFSYSYAKVNQLPVLILVDRAQDDPVSDETKSELEEIKSRGYAIQTVETDDAALLELPGANSYILDWFESMSRDRRLEYQKHSFRFKERVFEWIDHLFQNR